MVRKLANLFALSLGLFSVQADIALVDLFASQNDKASLLKAAHSMVKLEMTQEEYEWTQVLAEGWASPLDGFMTEDQYLTCTHFEHLVIDGEMIPMPVPIVFTVTAEEKKAIEGKEQVALTFNGETIAIMEKPSVYDHMKEERAGRTFGLTAPGHPYIDIIYAGGDFLVGGKIKVVHKFVHKDGMDQWRLTPTQLKAKFKDIGADAVFVFQLRNPVHNGHALLMQDTAVKLKAKGFKKPVLWLSPLGGWTKDDDVPLDVRMAQHHAIIKNGVFGDTEVVLAIFPSPMLYAGPREVQWHAFARLHGGATHYIVGRDPAGMKHPVEDKDIYEMWHGSKMLQLNPGLKKIELLPFTFASYDTKAKAMAFFDPKRKDDFVSISGSKMRKLAREGQQPPPGFMDPEGWDILTKFYQGVKQEL